MEGGMHGENQWKVPTRGRSTGSTVAPDKSSGGEQAEEVGSGTKLEGPKGGGVALLIYSLGGETPRACLMRNSFEGVVTRAGAQET